MDNNLLITHLFVTTLVLTVLALICSKRIRLLLYLPEESIAPLTKEEFFARFEDQMEGLNVNEKRERWKELLDKAWETRDYEIELCWKRTNYFWLFQVPALASFFLFNDSAILNKPDEVFIICCLGILFSVGWFLINKGSKQWQKHWEAYIDIFEDKYYGPLYKTVKNAKTYSVSKINEIVSLSVIFMWTIFALKVFIDNGYSLLFYVPGANFQPIIGFACLFTILMIISMLKGYGRGMLTEKKRYKFYQRDASYQGK